MEEAIGEPNIDVSHSEPTSVGQSRSSILGFFGYLTFGSDT